MNLNKTHISLWILGLSALAVVSHYNYLLFHGLAEVFSVVIACGIFLFAWNTRDFQDNSYLPFLGIAYLFVGIMDFFHTLAYKGMGVFPQYDADLPTQLWIAARYMESICLAAAPWFLSRKINPGRTLVLFTLTTGLLLAAVFTKGVFPACYMEGTGLTPFKIASEYIISGFLIGALVILSKNRNKFETNIYVLIMASIILTIGGELAFTFYVSVYGLSNMIGHLLKILSFYLIYKAVIETGLKRPYALLFRNLSRSEEELQEKNRRLNHEVMDHEKTAHEKEILIADLKKALAEVKTLWGILPICSYCKKIRDDEGYWNKVEDYVKKHSDADFSHSLCPECVRKHFAKYTSPKDPEDES